MDVVVEVDHVVAVEVDVEEVIEKAVDMDVVVEVDHVVAVEVDVDEVIEKAVDKDAVVVLVVLLAVLPDVLVEKCLAEMLVASIVVDWSGALDVAVLVEDGLEVEVQ
eukprot:614808-Amphidinium_carterae.1